MSLSTNFYPSPSGADQHNDSAQYRIPTRPSEVGGHHQAVSGSFETTEFHSPELDRFRDAVKEAHAQTEGTASVETLAGYAQELATISDAVRQFRIREIEGYIMSEQDVTGKSLWQ